MPSFDSIDLTAIAVQFIATIGVVLGVGIPAYVSLRRKADVARDNTEIIKSETRNAHAPERPMRHDIDAILEGQNAILSILESHGGEIAGIRGDVRDLHNSDKQLWAAVAGWRREKK